MANYRVPFAPWLGAGWNSAFRDANLTDAQFKNVNPGPGGGPGSVFPWEGNLYQVVRNRTGGSLAEGDLVRLYFGDATRVGTASAGAADQFTTTQTFAAGDFDLSVPGYVFVRAGTGINQRRRIRKFDVAANAKIYISLFDRSLNKAATSAADIFAVAADNTTQYSIVNPYECKKTQAATDFATGVALATVADTNWTIIEIAGFALVTSVGSTDALTAGGTVVPSGTAGAAKGPTTAGETAAEARLSIGMAIDAYASTAALRHIHMAPRIGMTYYPSTV